GGRPIATGPAGVARRERCRRAQGTEVRERLRVDVVGARPRPALQIAVVNGEYEVLRVHVGDQIGDAAGRLHRRVREISPEPDGVRLTFLAFFVVVPAESTARKGGRRHSYEQRDHHPRVLRKALRRHALPPGTGRWVRTSV